MRKIDITKGKVLFSCFHVDELTAYEMIKNKEQLTPINAPIGDLEMALIANPQSPYGFSAISKWDKDKWEYMGLGNSGACSIVTALLKELQAKEQECEELKTIINKSAEKFVNDYLETFEENQKLKDDLQNIQHNCTREGCRYYEDNTYKVFYKCKAKTEADKMEQKIKQVKSFVAGLMFDVDCINWFERFVVAFEDWKTQLGNDRDRYKQTLDEIEYQTKELFLGVENKDRPYCEKILDIINKAKDGE